MQWDGGFEGGGSGVRVGPTPSHAVDLGLRAEVEAMRGKKLASSFLQRAATPSWGARRSHTEPHYGLLRLTLHPPGRSLGCAAHSPPSHSPLPSIFLSLAPKQSGARRPTVTLYTTFTTWPPGAGWS